MAEPIAKRELEFQNLDEAVLEAERLQRLGYDRAGNWDLAQVCGHLADWMSFPLDGFPPTPLLFRPVFWMLRKTVGPAQLRKVRNARSVPRGVPTIPQTVPAPGRDEAPDVERLRRMVARFQAHDGPIQPSPLFGPMDRETATRLQLLHCAHHLGFLIPRDAPPDGS